MRYDNCNSCDPCGRCRRACAKPYFNLWVDPFDPTYYLWEMNGETGKVKIPKTSETDTTLSTDYSNSTLNYKAEKHTDVITGEQLGSIINLDDLRDVDATNPDACSILVFNPGCGVCPCAPDEERWKKYTIPDATTQLTPDSQGRVKVLAKTDCGCITEAYTPPEPDWECLFNNFIKAIAPFSGEGKMTDVETGGSTPEFHGGLNPNTGEFYIHWSDWYAASGLDVSLFDDPTSIVKKDLDGYLMYRVGQGVVNGVLTTTGSFDYKTGSMAYTITRVYYEKMTYTRDYRGIISQGQGGQTIELNLHIWGAFPGTHDLFASRSTLDAQGLSLHTPILLWGLNASTSDLNVPINKTINGTYVIPAIPAKGTSSWIDVMRVWSDWEISDDDGVVQVQYKNPLDWESC